MSQPQVKREPEPAADAPIRRADFLCRPRFTNTLPDIPFDGKFMNCPFVPLDRFVGYQATQLEKEYKHDLLVDDDMGVSIDLIDLDRYKVDPESSEPVITCEKDVLLIEEDSTNSLHTKRSAQHSRLVPWMRKTEYISTEYNRLGITSDRQETKLGYNLKKNKQDIDNMYRDHHSQIEAINRTFEDVKRPVTEHYSKKGVTALEEYYILPDFENLSYSFAQVRFDGDPSLPIYTTNEIREVGLNNSLLKGVKDAMGNNFFVHYSPSIETIEKILDDRTNDVPYRPDEVYEFNVNREYDWKIEAQSHAEHDNFVINIKDGFARYCQVDLSVKCTRRRVFSQSRKSKALVTYRGRTEREEVLMTEQQRKFLQPPRKNEQEGKRSGDEDDDDDQDEEKGPASGRSSSLSKSEESDAEPEPPKKRRKTSDDSDKDSEDEAKSDEEDDDEKSLSGSEASD